MILTGEGAVAGAGGWASGSTMYSVRYYSPRAIRLAIIIVCRTAKIREEKTIVLKNEVDYVDLQKAAELLGMSQRAVRNLAARRRLEVKREGEGAAARLVVSLASVEMLRLERQTAGKDSKV